MQLQGPHITDLHQFNRRKPKLLPEWARPILKYGVFVGLTAVCLWLASVSLV